MPATMEQYTLESLLSDKELRTDFIFYVNKRHAQESLLFWMEVEMFKRIIDSDECSKTQAKLLYFRYLHPSSKSEINVEGKLKAALESTMATGFWDTTLYNDVQKSVHECLKYSVVREFGEYVTKLKKTQAEQVPMTAAHVLLERYDGVVKHDKEGGTLRKTNALGWLKKKTQHALAMDRPRKEDKKSSFLGKYRIGKSTKDQPDHLLTQSTDSLPVIDEDSEIQLDDLAGGEMHRERLTQQRLQQQIQLLRNLHQHQQDRPNGDGQYATLEFASLPITPLAKSNSMPHILQRGASVVQLHRARS